MWVEDYVEIKDLYIYDFYIHARKLIEYFDNILVPQTCVIKNQPIHLRKKPPIQTSKEIFLPNVHCSILYDIFFKLIRN